jgi:hypothetical protein
MKKQTKEKTLTEEEMDEIAISQARNDDAWEEEFEVVPISKPRIVPDAKPLTKNPVAARHHR